jgi:hypothetical protein
MKARFRGGRALSRRPAGYGLGCSLALILTLGALAALGTLGAGRAAAQAVDWEGLSERFAIEAPQGLMPAGGAQTAPSIACDTTLSGQSWVVWEDNRLGDPDIFAARVTAAGGVRDSTGLPIALGPDRQTTPHIAAGEGTFLTVWQATDVNQSEWRIEGVRLSPGGEILDQNPLLIARSAYALLELDLAFGAGEFLVIWSDTLGPYVATKGVRISAADGAVLDEEPIVLSSGSRQHTGADVAFDGANYLLAYARQVTIYDTTFGAQGQITAIDSTDIGEVAGRFVDPDGAPSGEPFKIEPAVNNPDYTSDDRPMLAFTRGRYLVAWPARNVGLSQTSNRQIFGRTVKPDGTLSARFGIAGTDHPRDFRRMAVNAGGYQLVWVTQLGSRTTYYGVHVDTTGTQISAEYIVVPLIGNNQGIEDPGGCDITWNGTEYIFAAAVQYIAVAGDDQDIRISYLDSAGTVLGGPDIVGRAAPMQIPRAMAYDGNRYFAVWDEQVTGGWQVHGAFITEAGAIDGQPFTVVPGTLPQPWDPALAYGAGSFVLAWTDLQNLYAMQLDAAGQPVGSRFQVSNVATGRPALGWDGERFPVAWKYLLASDQGINMGRLELQGEGLALTEYEVTLPDSSVEVRSTAALYTGTSSDPAVACSGEQCMFLWTRKDLGVYGVQVADSGWNIPSPPTRFALGADPGVPRGVFDGTNYFVAWADLPVTYAVRVRPDGVVLDPGRIPLDVASETVDRPAVATDGYNRLAVWRTSEGSRWSLLGGRIGPDGQWVSGTEHFAYEDLSARWPLLVKGPDGQALMVYSTYIADPDHGSLRLYGKIWQQQPPSIDIAIHQNPGVTSDINIIASPSEEIPPGLLTIRANGTPIDVSLVDPTYNVYAGWYQARATEVVRIVASVGDSAGNVTRAERSFGIGEITPGDGGLLAGPNGVLSLACPPRAIEASSYVMILPDDGRTATPGTAGFLLSPPDLQLRAAAVLTVQVPACPAGLEPSAVLPVLERRTAPGWDQVPAAWNASEGALRAAITQLGVFRVRWIAAAEVLGSRLALSLGPAPWHAELALRYRLPESGPVQLAVFDAAGRRVATLVDGVQEGGREHTVLWNGTTADGGWAASGVYFAQLRYAGQTVTRRSIRVR